MSNNLVAYSRAGDVFHYRWAARRCLKLVYPNATVKEIVIEGSKEHEKNGEYVIDLTEYSQMRDNKNRIDYFQLKHSTTQLDKPFQLNNFKDTIVGFAGRFIQHRKEATISSIFFSIITNRKIDDSFKKNLESVIKGNNVDAKFKKTIEKYTNLKSDELVTFCSSLILDDGEGDYNDQKAELRAEIEQLTSGVVDNAQIDSIVSLVQEKVMPNSDGVITPQEILKRFGITDERQLYPAPPIWDNLQNLIYRKQNHVLLEKIRNSSKPVIIHAAGGVGKSIFCRQVVNLSSEGSLGLVYDCFGAGSYRSRSGFRHRHKDALVQIVNELAIKGLCDPYLLQSYDLEDQIMRRFLLSLDIAIKSLKTINNNAKLYILIDAADNAEMAAKEFSDSCFANELLREKFPEDCKIALLCRTERIDLLHPASFIPQFELKPFSITETLQNLRKWFPEATKDDGKEFHRLTAANPRVQSNAIDAHYKNSISQLFAYLSPVGTSVERQIELQLNSAVSKIKDSLTPEYKKQVDSICIGLASLPPHIPIDVLSKASDVSTETIKSFIADIGRALWLSDNSVQFRDEPTETWFRKTFLSKKLDFERYIELLEPFASKSSYIAEVLPQLYLQGEKYEKLISTALSDEYLPDNNPIDARNIRVFRLQFAFKAALRSKQYKDSIKLALRAGEEVAGNQRQITILKDNIDLLISLQSKEKIQEIAFKRSLKGRWTGSENIYTASLLSGIEEYQGETRGYIRASNNWLRIYFDEQKKKDDPYRDVELHDDDILELSYAYLNVFGVKECYRFLSSFRPKDWIFKVVQSFTRRLIDIGRFDEIDEMLNKSVNNVYFTVAITSELLSVGRFPQKSQIEKCLNLLTNPRHRIKRREYHHYDDRMTPAIIAFIEVCLNQDLSSEKILNILEYYVPEKASQLVSLNYQSTERFIFLKSLAIRRFLLEKTDLNIEEILPKEYISKEKKYGSEDQIREFKEIVNGLFPWFLLRVQILSRKNIDFLNEAKTANESSIQARKSRYRSDDTIPNEIAEIASSILILQNYTTEENLIKFYTTYLRNETFIIRDRLYLLRAFYRLPLLLSLIEELETSTYDLIKRRSSDGPEESSNRYISLARAVLISSKDDASVYFDEAIHIVSKFGDELVQRWESLVSLAKVVSDNNVSDELAYRFIRCAELVGDYVEREKYWNRDEALIVCTKMSPAIGISALSRWRDRDVGYYYDYHLKSMLHELIKNRLITPSVGWSLTRFFSDLDSIQYLEICIEVESSKDIQQKIFDDAVHIFYLNTGSGNYCIELKRVADKFKLLNHELDIIVKHYLTQEKLKIKPSGEILENTTPAIASNCNDIWESIFSNISINTSDGFSQLLKKFETTVANTDDRRIHFRDLLLEALNRIDEKLFWDFLDILLSQNTEQVNHYDISQTLTSIPKKWINKVSFKKRWSDFIFQFGKKFAHKLTNGYVFSSIIEDLKLDSLLIKRLEDGIFSGLADGHEFAKSNIFFGFINLASNFINSNDASNLLEYGLSRIELHVQDDFGDGNWDDWLNVKKDVNQNIAGFIWSALASPESKVRWNAAHSIRKLAELKCQNILDYLIEWLEYGKVGAFGSKDFPFYNLHARQYFLIAIQRISLDQPELLKKHSNIFSKYAISQPHALIQFFSSCTALNIEKSFPNTYSQDMLTSIQCVGKSKIPVRYEKYDYRVDSYWHQQNEVQIDSKFHFGWDFDRYWFEPLGRVFGVSGEQIQDLATQVVINEWGLTDNNGYKKDPRYAIWNRYSNERKTWHDHGGYPEMDNQDFYLSYHSMFVVAARLIDKMPVIIKRDWDDDKWDDWLKLHLLTREDEKWLSDCRDPLPLERPKWVLNETNESWAVEISEIDFLNYVKLEEDNNTWLNINGYLQERQKEKTETVSISSALVSNDTADSLLHALTTCNDPYDYKLPDYEEDSMEIDSDIFILKGWINKNHVSKGLDQFDPYADNITYPPDTVGKDIKEKFALEEDDEQKEWYSKELNEICVISRTWSSYREKDDEEPNQSGNVLKASLNFLQHLCKTLNYSLIIDISINREIHYKYDTKSREYTKPKHKIFILSTDGKLRTTDKNYQLR